MKARFLVIIFTCLGFIAACGGGGGSSQVPQTTPQILNVKLKGLIGSKSNFMIGEEISFEIIAEDPDLDMTVLYINRYLFPELETPYFPEIELILPTQPAIKTIYYPLDELIVEGPIGQWRACFLIVDSFGNESNEYCIHMSVDEF